MKPLEISPYLSEAHLKEVIRFVFDTEATTQKPVFIAGVGRLRVDAAFHLPSGQEVFVEFNGPTHYTRTSVIKRDYSLRQFCAEEKIMLAEIPYFIQLNNDSLEKVFGVDVWPFLENKTVTTPITSGFVARPIVLPQDFCLLGIARFLRDLRPSPIVQNGSEINSRADCWGPTREIWETLQKWALSDKEHESLRAALLVAELGVSDLSFALASYPT